MFQKKYFGKTAEGAPVYLFEARNIRGTKVEILNYGGIIRSLQFSTQTGEKQDVVLGYDNLESYQKQDKYFGAIIGRCANRIGGSSFSINGKWYFLSPNEGHNHLHGGICGFDKKVWEAHSEKDKLILRYVSADGEEGYPGKLVVTVTYCLTEDDELKVDYDAISDADTIVNLTNHSYFNLNGHHSGSILSHALKICSTSITPVTEDMIPLGTVLPIAGTPFDFREFHPIGERIDDSYQQLHIGGGYDHNYIIDGDGMRLAAELIGDKSGIKMDVYTDMDGVQLYTGNFIAGVPLGKDGVFYQNRSAVCLETQFAPNAINCPVFPSPLLRAGDRYRHRTIYHFKTFDGGE